MALTLLKDNLQEVYASIHHADKNNLELVPNYAGTRLYHASSGWGRLWRWFYQVLDWLTIDCKQNERLCKAICKTQAVYTKQIEKLEENIRKYQEYIELKSLGVETDEMPYYPVRRKIVSWNNATGPFLELFSKKNRELFSKWTTQNGLKEQPFFNPPKDQQELQSISYLINLEAHLKGPLPLHLFRKLACAEELDDKETKLLMQWIETNNLPDTPLKIEHFHPALVSFITHLKKNTEADLYRLELALTDLGLKIFQEKDSDHLAWREALKPGDKLGDLILGKRIGEKCEDDKTFIYSIKDDPEKVAVIASNRALLGMKKRIEEENGWGIRHADMLYLDPNGRYAVYERLQDSIADRQWCTKNVWVSKADEDVLIPVENMLLWMLQKQITPVSLDPKYLMFDAKGVLRYSKVCLPGEFNFTGMEEFIYKCCKDVQKIYIHLMEKSKLYAHPSRNYYREMMESALQNSRKDPADTAALLSITDPRIVDRGKELYDEISTMKETAFQSIARKYEVPNTKTLRHEIKKQIRAFYVQTKLVGLLWPTMTEKVVEKVVNKLKLKPRVR